MNFQKWMENLHKKLLYLPLNELSIPGTHDSFTYSIKASSKISPDADEEVKILVCTFGILARKIIVQWAVTQIQETKYQLECGIRYFDIRLSINDKGENGIFSCHGFFASRIIDELAAIRHFLLNNDKEVIFLDLNHFYAFTDENHQCLIKMIKKIFESKLVTFRDTIPSLSELWQTEQRVFVFYHHSHVDGAFWPGSFVPSPWADTDNVDTLIEFLEMNYNSGDRRSPWFNVSQGILTPTAKTILTHPCGNLRTALARRLAPRFLSWLTEKSPGINKINFVIVDYFDDDRFVSDVINLNNKLL